MRFPVSQSQQSQWFLDQISPGEPTFHIAYAVSLDGPLDADALQRALDAAVARHASLRTSIVAFDGVPEQEVADSGAVVIERIDLPEAADGDERTRQAESIAADRARQPFDLADGPPIRATLIRTGPDRHLFVLVLHHIITDGTSMQILMEELSAFYRAELTGVPASLPPLPMSYGDYALWQQGWMSGPELEHQLSYWRDQLNGAPQVLALPTDRPRPARLSSCGARIRVTVDDSTVTDLAEVAQAANATMFMAFLAGFVVVLARYARQHDLVISTQAAGRTRTDFDPIIGMFANTVLLRISLADNPSFTELLGRIRDTTADALSHQRVPFEKLVKDLVPDLSLAHAPLAQVQFAYHPFAPPGLDLPGVTSNCQMVFTDTAKLDLDMYVDNAPGQDTTLVLDYNTDLFRPPWADHFLSCVAHLLKHAAQTPDRPVAELPIVSAAELDELIVGRNRQPTSESHGMAGGDGADVRELLLASPSRVIDGAGDLPMSEVRDRAARLARILADHGVSTGTLIGICAERGAGMLTAMFAVWWAGSAYVPLDPSFPEARLTAMAQGANLRIIISDSANSDLALSVAGHAEVVRLDDPAVADAPPLAPVPVPGNALAYVIFTSGSTGQPKGVAIEHQAVANLIGSFRRSLRLGSDDRVVAVTTLSFDIAILELLLPLVCGADLVIATFHEAREPDRLRSLIQRTGATMMQATPQTWRMLDSVGVPASLRLRLCGGEALPADLAERLMEPGATLWNVYGPTETTVWSAARVVTNAVEAAQIGPPIENTRVYVLDERLMPVPVGVIGEVYLAGRGVACGYRGRPELTARSFRPDPWSDEPGSRMYRTGDLGRWLEGDGLELIGRNDHQVKVRGYRIECGEVEAALRAHPGVRQAAVITADRAGEPALVAYIVPRRNSSLTQPDADAGEELRQHLRTALPDYMVPSLVVTLPALPLTPNAKVDRAALPAPQWSGSLPAAERIEPRNPVEAALVRIWSDILATNEPIGVHDNVFAAGGHSLTAAKFVIRVADTYGVNLPIHHVFASPTISQLAEIISADPDFGRAALSSREAELDALSDEDLDELLRAALAQRHRRDFDRPA
ncbi:MAG TPA: amino acid adenylation domain-containing protein [Streptosporangiaceae bacterium]